MSPRSSRSPDTQASSLGLRRIKLLEGLSEKCLGDLAGACAWRSYEAGQYIISREADDSEVYLLVSGRIRVTVVPDVRRLQGEGDPASPQLAPLVCNRERSWS